MKTTSLLALPFSLVLASMVASIGCSTPTLQPYDDIGDDDEDESESASSKKKKTTNKNNSSSNDTSNSNTSPAPSGTVPPPPADSTPPPSTPPPNDAEACMDQCLANGPAAQYWQCSASCQDIQCDDNCWFGSVCGQQEQACGQAIETCDQQCGFFGEGF